jgi:hypothetical protein
MAKRWVESPDEGEDRAALAGLVTGPWSRLLGVAATAAVAWWLLVAVTPALLGLALPRWAGPALEVAAFAALLAWFVLAGAGRPARARGLVLAGLLLSILAEALVLLPSAGEAPSPADPPARVVRLVLAGTLPTLLAAAIGCFLLAFLRLPATAPTRPPWPRSLPAFAGLAWGIDAAVGLWWLARFEPASPDEAALLWPEALLSAARMAAVGLAVVLAFAVVTRRPLLTRPAARAALAGALLLAFAWSFLPQLAATWLVPFLPLALGAAIFSAPVLLASFAGAALLTVVAAAPPALPGGVVPASGFAREH